MFCWLLCRNYEESYRKGVEGLNNLAQSHEIKVKKPLNPAKKDDENKIGFDRKNGWSNLELIQIICEKWFQNICWSSKHKIMEIINFKSYTQKFSEIERYLLKVLRTSWKVSETTPVSLANNQTYEYIMKLNFSDNF